MNDVTFILTSCNRFDLLQDTIDSFLKCNIYPIREFIITEDSGDIEMYDKIKKYYGHLFKHIIFNKNKPRQKITIIDQAYKLIKTDFVFHCEDDWHFHNENKVNFIKNSIEVLKENSEILVAHIRDKHTIIGQKVEDVVHVTKKGVKYSYLTRYGEWNGFSLNPGLRRLSDYKLIAPFSQFLQPATAIHNSWTLTESVIARIYTNKNYIGAHVGNHCYHTGSGRRV